MPSEKCFHCGDECRTTRVEYDGKVFCCNGCKSVYSILNHKRLYDYYHIENCPGTKAGTSISNTKYAYLDNEEIVDSLLNFKDGSIYRCTLYIPSIHCSSCIWLLENLHKLHSGVIHSRVNFVKKEVGITYDHSQISFRQLVEILASVSYEPYISLKDTEKKEEKRYGKEIIYRLGVAGFCFGNIMLLSFPDYFSGGHASDHSYIRWFGIINFILSLPVVFYSADIYFKSAFKNLFRGNIVIDLPVALGIITLFLRSSYEIFTFSGSGYLDSLAGLVFFLLIGRWYQEKTYRALSFERNYTSYFPVAVAKITENTEDYIPLSKLKTGDRIRIRNGELIPADAILISGEAHVDYSFVTGESVPVDKIQGDTLFAGGKQAGGAIELEIIREVSQSYLTQLWNEDQENQSSASVYESVIDSVSKYFTFGIIIIASIAGLYWVITDMSRAVFAFTSVLIIACPCALALTLPFTFGSTVRIFGRLGFYLKKNTVVELLSKVDTIVFDKTGTLTEPFLWDVTYEGDVLTEQEQIYLKSIAWQSVHPLSKAVSSYYSDKKVLKPDTFEEIISKGLEGTFDGNIYKLGSDEFVQFGREVESDSAIVYVSVNGEIRGRFYVQNKYRSGLELMVSGLKNKYNLYILSGDNDRELKRLSEFFPADNIRFNQKATDKLEFIESLKKEKKKVLMVGDGLNDAGALKSSYAGISVADNLFYFTPASDAIIEGDKLTSLERFLSFSKRNITIIKLSFLLSFLYNIIGTSLAVQGNLTPLIAAILMPASSVTVVAFVTAAVFLTSYRMMKLKTGHLYQSMKS
jgi:P-type Cu+ transporter